MQLVLRRFTPRTFCMVTLAAAMALRAIVAIPQLLSKQARMQVLRAGVAEVARLATSVVDGDLYRQLSRRSGYGQQVWISTLDAPQLFQRSRHRARKRTPACESG